MKPTRRLRDLLAGQGIVMAAGAYDALTARLVEQAGFPLCVMGGNALSVSLGYPDLGLTSMTEVARAARCIAGAVTIPVIADADTGFGGALNVWRTVRDFEGSGVAGLHIEDQAWPKRAGHMTGKKVVPTGEMAGKIRVAREAREDADFVIIARCDALMVTGLDDTLERGEAYLEAGADVLFFETRDEMDEIEALAERFRGRVPLLYNHSESGKVPLLPASELEALGFKIAAFYGHAQLAACRTMREVLAEILRTGNSKAIWERMLPLDDVWKICDLAKLEALQETMNS
jgi:2-methylisocitrate lyase-like PEP mutase family enzyme